MLRQHELLNVDLMCEFDTLHEWERQAIKDCVYDIPLTTYMQLRKVGHIKPENALQILNQMGAQLAAVNAAKKEAEAALAKTSASVAPRRSRFQKPAKRGKNRY